MSGAFPRSRFFQLPKYDSILSSRFGDVPALMLQEREPTPHQMIRSMNSPFNSHMILPPIKYKKFGSTLNNVLNLPFNLRKPPHATNATYHHSILDYLLSTLPDDECLPDVPIVITQEQENSIFLETNYQLSNYDPVNLRDLYITLTNIDQDLIGCVSYKDLLMTFQRKQVPITEQLLRLVASQFVSRKEYGRVNYERVLSFIGAALKMNKDRSDEENFASTSKRSQRDPDTHCGLRSPGKNVYYHDSHCRNEEDVNACYTERDDPAILRLLETSVRHQFTPINLESLRLAFQRADSLHRGSLSEQQIKDLCFHRGIQIDDSVIEKVIRRCKQRGGGQYDWQQFVRYLERVQPVQTSLNMTSSRMPNELIKYIPHPSSSWPQAESPVVWGSPLHRHESPKMPMLHHDNYDADFQLPPPLAASNCHPIQCLDIDENEPDPLQLKLNKLQEEVFDLTNRRNKYEDVSTETQPTHNSYVNQDHYDVQEEDDRNQPKRLLHKPRFDRFMDMANHIYIEDRSSSGTMSRSKLFDLVNKFNSQLELGFKRDDIVNALAVSEKSSGSVDISHFLQVLAVKC